MKFQLLIVSLVVIGLAVFLFSRSGRSEGAILDKKIFDRATLTSVEETLGPIMEKRLSPILKAKGFSAFPEKLSLLAFKEEQKLEVYGWKNNQPKLLKTYDFTAFSGKLGPKLKEGDKQIPEGVYKMEYLNPNSSYHLSIKVSYPNEFDQIKGKLDERDNLGGDIFIHGKAVTIGCIPIGDVGIEELFVLSIAAKKGIDIIISPRDFRKNGIYPIIESVEWELELYDQIKTTLAEY